MRKMFLPLASMDKIFREVDTKRVSDQAKEELRTVIEERAKEVGKLAAKFADHAGRRTILEEDVKLALEHLK